MKVNPKTIICVASLVLSLLAAAFPLIATAAPEPTLEWSTLDGGGAQSMTGGTLELSGTLGQFDARNHPDAMTGGNYSMTGGFWVIPECPAIPGDYDEDCDVDQADYLAWEACASGPDVPHAGGCGNTDFDGDLDTDQDDFAVLQGCYTGENQPGDPACAG